MAQGFPGRADRYRLLLDFYVSPSGTWSIDLELSNGWEKYAIVPITSGTADRPLSDKQAAELRDLVLSHVAVGISRIVAPF